MAMILMNSKKSIVCVSFTLNMVILCNSQISYRQQSISSLSSRTLSGPFQYRVRRLIIPDSKVHGANMGPIWGRQVRGGPHVGPSNFDNWDGIS